MKSALIRQLAWLHLVVLLGAGTSRASAGTHVSIDGGYWRINDKPTYLHSPAQGLLMNVRMVNAVFEDRNRAVFDADLNTDEFIAQDSRLRVARRPCIHDLPAGRLTGL